MCSFVKQNMILTSKKPSFLIRDILGIEPRSLGTETHVTSQNTRELRIPFLPYPVHPMTIGTTLPSSYGYHRAWNPLTDVFGDHRDSPLSIPIPLPVYIRTRSPSSLDLLGKAKKCRRSRTVFSELQLMGLEKRFDQQKYLSTPDRMDLAESLGLTQIQVKTWYQNRRMKWKKQVMQKGGAEPPTKPKGRPKKSSLETIKANINMDTVETSVDMDTVETSVDIETVQSACSYSSDASPSSRTHDFSHSDTENTLSITSSVI